VPASSATPAIVQNFAHSSRQSKKCSRLSISLAGLFEVFGEDVHVAMIVDEFYELI